MVIMILSAKDMYIISVLTPFTWPAICFVGAGKGIVTVDSSMVGSPNPWSCGKPMMRPMILAKSMAWNDMMEMQVGL